MEHTHDSKGGRFQIECEFHSPLSASQQEVVVRAAERWARCIVAPLVAIDVGGGRITSGLVLKIHTGPMDGAEHVLGRAGPTLLRPAGAGRAAFLPAVGELIFDAEDLKHLEEAGRLAPLAHHEIGHALGIGTEVWQHKSLLEGHGSENPTFRGSRAMAEFGSLRGDGGWPVPVENRGGRGVANAHWREATFGDEMMSSYVSGPAAPLSRLTLASLGDLGYEVDLEAADAYSLPSHNTIAADGGNPEHRHFLSLSPVLLPLEALRP